MTQCDPDARTLKDCMEVAASVDAHIKELLGGCTLRLSLFEEISMNNQVTKSNTVFQCPDGTLWETQAGATEHARKTKTRYKVRRLNKRFTRIAAALEVARSLLECVCEGKEVPLERLEAARTLCAKALGTIRKPRLDGAQE